MQNLQLPDKPANQDSYSISLGDRTHRAAIIAILRVWWKLRE
jgi:hypothetical protein